MATAAAEDWRNYEVRHFASTSALESVAHEWEAVSGSDEFEVELGSLFEWCTDHLVPIAGDGHAMQVLHTGTGETHAILEMVNGKRGALSKLLRLFVSPQFWPADRDLEVRDRFEALYTVIFVQVISEGIVQDGVEEIRVYGRSDLMYAMLKSLSANWGSIPGLTWSATMERRWLGLKLEAE